MSDKRAIGQPTMTPGEEAAWVEMARTRRLREVLLSEPPRGVKPQAAYERELARRAEGVQR